MRLNLFISLIAIILVCGIIDIQPAIAVSNQGLVGYWSFNEGKGTTATDFSGNGNKGTLTNGPTWVKGRFGKALKFDGVNDYVSLDNTPSFGNAMSVSAWVKMNAYRTTGNDDVVFNVRTVGNIGGFTLQAHTATNNWQFYVYTDSWSAATFPKTNVPVGEWHLITGTYDGSNIRIYLDGVLKGTTAKTGSINNPASPNSYIGASAIAAEYINALIDDVRIYNRALSAAEIQALYKAGAAKHNNPSNTGLVGYWSFNEGKGTTATDFSGNGNKGTLTNGPTWVKGRFGKALKFDGVNDYVSVADNANLQFDNGKSITLSAWVKPSTLTPPFQTILTKGRTTGVDTTNYAIRIGDGVGLEKRFVFYYRNAANNAWNAYRTNSDQFAVNQWSHVAATYTFGTGNSIKLYVDGVEKAGTWVSGTGNDAPYLSTEPLWIGAENTLGGGAVDEPFNGLIDDVRIYNRALSAAEIQALYKAGAAKHNNPSNTGLVGYWSFNEGKGTTATDFSGNGNKGTLTNGPTWVKGRFGKALKFDGVNDYVRVENNASLNPPTSMTVSAWIRPTDLNPATYGYQIAIKWGGVSNLNQYHFWINASGILQFHLQQSNGIQVSPSGGTLTAGQWQHVVGVADAGAGRVKIYINGNEVASQSYDGTINTGGASPTQLGIGVKIVNGVPTDPGYFKGSIDDVRIYNRALSAAEIQALYKAGAAKHNQ